MSTPTPWASHAYLDALRPDPGWTVKTAILASYSADLTSIGAVLLALAGRDDERGSGSKADMADAVEELRGKVRIVIQRGRLAKLKRLPAVAGILDQFLTEVPFDEATRSWHPKLALVCLQHPKAGTAWRLWLGSRNVTTAENLDFGLTLDSGRPGASRGAVVPGIEDLAERLALHAALPKFNARSFARQAGAVRWTGPVGMKVLGVRLTSGTGDYTLPICPTRLDEVVVIGPFLDGGFVRTIGGWGLEGTRRTLLSTHAEMRKVAARTGHPLRGYGDRLLTLDGPRLDIAQPEPIVSADAPDDTVVEIGAEDPPPLGLHAKILAARTGGRVRLWVGSANATERAWRGRNVEIIAELEADASVFAGIAALLQRGRPVAESELTHKGEDPIDAVRDRLDEARRQANARWTGGLRREDDLFELVTDRPPHPDDEEVFLEAGLATGALYPWLRGSTVLELGRQPLGLQTALVQFRLSLAAQECVWLQTCDVTPPLDLARDRAALAQHLGPRAFLDWIRSLIRGGVSGESDPRWDAVAPRGGSAPGDVERADTLTLEDILSCWSRDRAAFARADERMRSFLDPVIAATSTSAPAEAARLDALRSLWTTLRASLGDAP